MEASNFAKTLDFVQSEIHSILLKSRGFSKKGRTHNRKAAGGIIHAINFQMGQHPIGENYVVPGLRENLYGLFTINLGAFLPCVYEVEQQKPSPAFVQEPYCSIRSRLGQLASGKDQWFNLGADPDELTEQVMKLLHQFGLPFLDIFNSYEAVLTYYDENGKLPGCPSPRSALVAAIIANQTGNTETARALLTKAKSGAIKPFREHVAKIAGRIGLELPE